MVQGAVLSACLSRGRRGTRGAAVVLAALLALLAVGPVAPAQAAGDLGSARVDLRVLVVDSGGPGEAALMEAMDREGLPYTRIADVTPITPDLLEDTVNGAPRAKFQAVVLANSAPAALDATEMATLEAYERKFGVRQVNAYLFPTTADGLVNQWSGTLDGMTATVAPAALAGPFSYLRGAVPIDDVDTSVSESFGYLALPVSPQPAGQSYEPFLTVPIPGTSTDGALLGVQTDNGREEMIITGAFNQNMQWFAMIAPGIINWATRGVHLGFQRSYFAVQIDDTFVPDGRWSLSDNCTPGDDYCTATTTDIRMVPSDVDRLVAWQNANDFRFDIAFNGGGSLAYKADPANTAGTDPLLDAFVAADATQNFEWINHTLDHTFLGCIQIAPTVAGQTWRCATSATDAPRQDAAIPGTMSGGTYWASQAYVDAQIRDNSAWAAANLPGAAVTPRVLVTGEHSGLLVAPQQPTDSPFFGPVLDTNSVVYTASDASREKAQRPVAGGSAKTLPRYPMNIFYNVATFQEEVDEYNWIYTSRADGGSGICEDNPLTSTCITPLPAGSNAQAQQSFTSFIKPLEVRNALAKVLTNDPRPFYAHQSNLAEDGILYPVVEQVLATYRTRYAANAPLVKLTMRQQGDELGRQTAWRAAKSGVTAYLDSNGLTIAGAGGTAVPVTVPEGSAGGSLESYGGERSGWVGGDQQVTVPDVGYRNSPPAGTAPGAPTVGTATAGDASATVTWTAPAADGGSPITGYTVRAFAGGASTAATTASAGSTATSLVVSGLTNGTSYTFDVAAVNAVGTGPASELTAPVTPQAVTAPAAPVITSVAPGNSSATVTWTAPNANGSPITGYSVRAFLGTTNTVARTVSAPAAATSLAVTGLTNGTTYTFDVRAINAIGTSPPSVRSEAVTPSATATAPSAPTIGTVTPGNASATVTWSPPADTGGATLTGYRVRAFNGTGTTVARTLSVGASATSGTVLSLTNGNPYSFDVRALYGTTLGVPSARSEVVTPTADATAPTAPVLGTVTPGNTTATVTWSPPADTGGLTVTGYRVRAFSGTTNTVVRTASAAAGAASVTVTGLTNGSSYTFDVRAVYGTTIGAPSARSGLVTLAVTVPGAPRIGSPSPGALGGELTAIARWQPPTSTGGSPITGYVVTALRMSGGVVVAQVVSQVQPASARLLEMVLPAGSYRFTVQAVNAVGTGPASGRSALVSAR